MFGSLHYAKVGCSEAIHVREHGVDEGEREKVINLLCWVMIKGQCWGDYVDAQSGLTTP